MAKADKEYIDPEQRRWHKTYPKFPGVSACLQLMHRNYLNGTWKDQIFYELVDNASETAEELIAAFRAERESWVRTRLLAIMAEANLPVFQSLFVEFLHSEEDGLQQWAVFGLQKINTKEARIALWEREQLDSGRLT